MKIKILLLMQIAILAGNWFAQSGAPYEITQSVISNGGGTSDGLPYSVSGTAGQPIAGTNSTGDGFSVRGGFWQSFFTPTAATVEIRGQVVTAQNGGIFNVRVTLSGGTGEIRTAVTNPFGYFRFEDVETGQTYVISIKSKRYQFANPTQVVFVGDEITGLTFNALP